MVNKREVINYIQGSLNATEVDLVDDNFEDCARHVCLNGRQIKLIPRRTFTVNTPEGQIPVETYQCLDCGKLIINKNFM